MGLLLQAAWFLLPRLQKNPRAGKLSSVLTQTWWALMLVHCVVMPVPVIWDHPQHQQVQSLALTSSLESLSSTGQEEGGQRFVLRGE
jgi:hypothetical protein